MNHQQILDKLAAKHLVDAIEEDICRLARDSLRFLGRQGFPYTTLESYLLPRLMNRWECVLEAPKGEVSANYQQKTCSALAVLLHKYGMQDKDITQHAIKSIRTLNKSVALSDDFARKESEIIAFLEAAPEPLKRNPSVRETLTFYRGGDVISIQYRKKFYAAYIHSIENFNSYPCLEFYDAVFDHRPNLGEIIGHPAKGKNIMMA